MGVENTVKLLVCTVAIGKAVTRPVQYPSGSEDYDI